MRIITLVAALLVLLLLAVPVYADESDEMGLLRWWATEQAIEYGLPNHVWFLRQINAESRWDTRAVSSRGARGILQILPAYHDVDPDDPWASITYAAKLMHEYHMAFRGRYDLALAAYANGPARVRACWCLPNAETRWYVTEIMRRTE